MLIRLLALCAALGLHATPAQSQDAPPPADTATPADEVAVTPASGEPGLAVDEALDMARRAIDVLAASKNPADRQRAEHDLDRTLAIIKTKSPDHPWLPYLYAFVSLKQGQSWDAVDHLQNFVRTRDGRTEWKAYRTLGDLEVDQFPRLARSHYDKAASLIDGEPSVLYGLSRCAANVGNYAEALTFAKQAVSADKRQSVEYLTHLARVAAVKKEWSTATTSATDALAVTLAAVTARPGSREPLLAVNGQYKQLMEIETAWLKDVRDPDVLSDGYIKLAEHARERAKIVARLSRHEVVSILDAGLERLGEDASVEILEQTIVAYDDVDRVEDAIDVCRRILKKQPENTVAKEWLARFGEPVESSRDEEDHDHDGDGVPDH